MQFTAANVAVIKTRSKPISIKVTPEIPIDFITTISESEDILDKETIIPTYKVIGSKIKPTDGIEYNTSSDKIFTGTEPDDACPKSLFSV